MTKQHITTASLANRRRARRCTVSGHAKIECRKGAYGLGRNLAVTTLDLSETGARLIVQAAVAPGEAVELLLSGPGVPKPFRRPGKVVWSVLLPDGSHAIGVALDRHLTYGDLQRLAKV
jgi:PilZ domain